MKSNGVSKRIKSNGDTCVAIGCWSIYFTARDSLYDYLEEGYKIAAVTDNNLVIGTIIWIWFDDLGYGRIEYIATQKTHQQQGFGGLLIDYVLSELSKVLNYDLHNYFYLDLNIENKTASKLYNKKGFEIQYQDYVYRLKLE